MILGLLTQQKDLGKEQHLHFLRQVVLRSRKFVGWLVRSFVHITLVVISRKVYKSDFPQNLA